MRNKGIANIFIWIIGLLIVGSVLTGGSLFKGILTSSVINVNGQNAELILQPTYGRIACEPISNVDIYNQIDFYSDNRQINNIEKCGDNENSPSCSQFTVFCSQTKKDIFGNLLPMEFLYQSSKDSNCLVAGSNWCRFATQSAETQLHSSMLLGDNVRIGGCIIKGDSEVFGRFTSGWYNGYTRLYYKPYGLNTYASGGKFRYSANSCNVGALNLAEINDVCMQSDGEACSKVKTANTLGFDDWVNYLDAFLVAPIDANQNKLVAYNGQQVYAQYPNLWELGIFKTATQSYAYPKRIVATIGVTAGLECLPGQQTSTAACGDDFKWKSTVSIPGTPQVPELPPKKIQCISDVQCPGAGNFFDDRSTLEIDVSRYACILGKCQKVETRQTQCVPPTTGCPSGKVCNPSTYVCESQTGVSVVKGDGICSKPWENELNTPEDCKASSPLTMGLLALLLVGGGIAAAIFLKRRK